MNRTHTVDQSQFESQIQEALARLYDLPFLQHSPLLSVFAPGRSAAASGKALHQALLEAIEQLKPSAEVSPEAIAWRLYRSLVLRYIRSLSAGTVARELGLSTRQAQRIHAIAVASLATALWESWTAHRADSGEPLPTATEPLPVAELAPPPGGEASADDTQALEAELDAILAGDRGEPQPFPLIVHSAIETISPILRQRRIRPEVSIDGSLTHAVAYHDLARQVLVQLLLGALTFSESGILRISATPEAPGALLTITAADQETDGTKDARLLDRRIRVAERLLRALGGSLTMEADPTLRMTVRLPLEDSPTVLVIEDNPQVVQLFQRYLAGTPYQLRHVGDSDQALDTAIREHPEIITLDIMMPRRDGWELLQALQIDPRTQDIPVLICSVLRDQELALALGATDFLPKPVTQHDLLRALNRCRSVGRVPLPHSLRR